MWVEPLAARREAALIALTLKQLGGDCRELLREHAPILVTVKVPEPEVIVARIPESKARVSQAAGSPTPRKVKFVGLPQVLQESR